MMKRLGMLVLMLSCSLSLAYRDVETGTFLTRDPIGYGDGPNVYCYVYCNPITSFDALGLWSVNSDGGLDYDGHLNVYDPSQMDFDDSIAGLLVNYNDIRSMTADAIRNDRDTIDLGNGIKVSTESMRQAYLANNDIFSSTATANKNGRTKAYEALNDGHMGYTEAMGVRDEVVAGGSVLSMGEHYSARFVLNEVETASIRNDPLFAQGKRGETMYKGFQLYSAGKSAYHGPGCYKWVHSDGREIVLSVDKVYEIRDEFMGTYNFGPKAGHSKLDMEPYYMWGNTPLDQTPYQQRVYGPKGAGKTEKQASRRESMQNWLLPMVGW